MKIILALAMFSSVVPLFAGSYYAARLDDPRAIYLTQDRFPVKVMESQMIPPSCSKPSIRFRRRRIRAFCSFRLAAIV